MAGLYGYNTDYAGFAYLARAHGVDFAGKTVLILGTGGTHSTVTAVCKDGGAAEILTASRTGKGDALTYEEAMRRKDVQVIVNTTPCGDAPECGAVPHRPGRLSRTLEAVLDVVYNPFRTELLLRAEEHHIPAASGFEMLVAQAVFAAEHFTGKALDADTLIPAVSRQLRHELANISIIGMPGCGKSTIGAALAKKLGKTFIDLDAEIERRTGHNIPRHPLPRRAKPLSAGTKPKRWPMWPSRTARSSPAAAGSSRARPTCAPWRQNGPVLWARRPIEKLATGGRPLSKGGAALKQLEEERNAFVRAGRLARVVLDNTGTLREAADKAAALFEADETL